MKIRVVFAFLAVVIIALSPLAAVSEDSYASVAKGILPEPKEYLYKMTTDSKNMQITRVDASVDGSALSKISGVRTESAAIPDFWAFDCSTGMGPFNSFYAAINIVEGGMADSGEELLNNAVGTIAFVLDPYDLSKTLAGTEYAGKYNIMLVIPAVYWKAVGNVLYMSSSSSYKAGSSTVSGMVAYAHCAGDGKTFTNVYPYIGIGVYEAYVDSGKLVSVSGVKPSASNTCDQFKSYVDALTPAANSDYQQWNFYQWSLYKMMAYTVMGTKNSQAMMGSGPVNNDSSSTTGLADYAGPYATATSSYSKLFIENSWGSLYEFVGDACFYNGVLYTGNDLGGKPLGKQTAVEGVTLPSYGWISSAYSDSAIWDFPKSYGGSSSGFDVPGDYVWSNSGWCSQVVGGYWANGSNAGVAFAYGNANLSYSNSHFGARLAYVMSDDAVSTLQIHSGGLKYSISSSTSILK